MKENKNKYKVTWEITVEVEAENIEEATKLAEEKWANGEARICPYIEEINS